MGMRPVLIPHTPDARPGLVFKGTVASVSPAGGTVVFGPYQASFSWELFGPAIEPSCIRACDLVSFVVNESVHGSNMTVTLLEHDPQPRMLSIDNYHDQLVGPSTETVSDTPNNRMPKLGEVYIGRIDGVTDFGFFVRIGVFRGLVHRSDMAEGIDPESLQWGGIVKIIITRMRYDGKMSFGMLEVLHTGQEGNTSTSLTQMLGHEDEGFVTSATDFVVQIKFGNMYGFAYRNWRSHEVTFEGIQAGDTCKIRVDRVRSDGMISLALLAHYPLECKAS